ncbi:hypothetical protein PG1629B_0896 [Bifidobacterium pseudolongum subsp. pseudolongum]|nr:hypothetical protein PG1629B_0896 [Bifidobacterium pseudolongum subsp. pseudolongum]
MEADIALFDVLTDLTAKQANAPVSSILLSIISTVFADSRWKPHLNSTTPSLQYSTETRGT